MKRLEAKVTGHVQGVFFRAATQRRARELGLGGWVRNEPDGTVRVVAEGEKSALEQLASFLHQGSPAAEVRAVETTWDDATGEFNYFQVRQ